MSRILTTSFFMVFSGLLVFFGLLVLPGCRSEESASDDQGPVSTTDATSLSQFEEEQNKLAEPEPTGFEGVGLGTPEFEDPKPFDRQDQIAPSQEEQDRAANDKPSPPQVGEPPLSSTTTVKTYKGHGITFRYPGHYKIEESASRSLVHIDLRRKVPGLPAPKTLASIEIIAKRIRNATETIDDLKQAEAENSGVEVTEVKRKLFGIIAEGVKGSRPLGEAAFVREAYVVDLDDLGKTVKLSHSYHTKNDAEIVPEFNLVADTLALAK